jgi:poly-beta-1,6-N-acetyl-D-glucosamine synthase
VAIPVLLALISLAALGLIWVGYPVIVWLVATVRSKPIEPDAARGAKALVSVILATRETADLILARVSNLLDSDHPRELLEVIVALDGSVATNHQLWETQLDPEVRIVGGDVTGGKAGALNAGVRVALGELLVFADSQQRFERTTIPALAAALQDERFGAVSGALTLGGKGTPVHAYWRLEKWLRFNEARIHSAIGVTGAVYGARRSHWTPIPDGTLLDDLFVPMAMILKGLRIGFEPSAIATDIRTFDSDVEARRKTRTQSGIFQLHRALPNVLSPMKNPVWLAYSCHKLLRMTTPVWVILAGVSSIWVLTVAVARLSGFSQFIFFALVLVVFSIPYARRRIVSLVKWAYAMQRSTISAITNGIRGTFDVWHRSR